MTVIGVISVVEMTVFEYVKQGKLELRPVCNEIKRTCDIYTDSQKITQVPLSYSDAKHNLYIRESLAGNRL